jgi:hypothetical protein
LDLKVIFENIKSDLLTEEVKTKITTLFEAAVSEKVNEKVEELNTKAEEFKVQEATRLEEKAVEFVDVHLLDKIDEYFDYIAQEFFTENKIAITEGLKSQMYDKIVGDVKKVLSENQIKEEKIVEQTSLIDEVKTLKESLNDTIKSNMDLKKKIKGLEALSVFESVTQDCSETEKEKVMKLCEDFDIDNVDEFRTKVETIKESVASKASEANKGDKTSASASEKKDDMVRIEEDVKIQLEEPVANSGNIVEGMMKFF